MAAPIPRNSSTWDLGQEPLCVGDVPGLKTRDRRKLWINFKVFHAIVFTQPTCLNGDLLSAHMTYKVPLDGSKSVPPTSTNQAMGIVKMDRLHCRSLQTSPIQKHIPRIAPQCHLRHPAGAPRRPSAPAVWCTTPSPGGTALPPFSPPCSAHVEHSAGVHTLFIVQTRRACCSFRNDSANLLGVTMVHERLRHFVQH